MIRLPALLAVLSLLPVLQGCGGCNDQTLVSREPVPVEDDDEAYQPLEGDWGSWLSMSVSYEGAPAIAYYNRTKGALGYAEASWTDAGELRWRHEQVDGYADESGFDSGDRGQYTSMAVAADGRTWIAYQDVQNQNLRYATRAVSETTWTVGSGDSDSPYGSAAGFYTSMALDQSGNPIIAHYDEGVGQLRVSHWNGSAFTGMTVDEGEAGVDTGGAAIEAHTGKFPSITVAEGIEYIAYYDVLHGDLKLAWGTAGSYSIETVDAGDAEGLDVGQWPDIAVSGGEIHIAYHDATNGDLRYARGVPGSWTIEVVDTGDHVGADTVLWFSGDKPVIAYFDGRNNDMKQAWPSGDGWQNRVVTEDPGALGFHNEVVVAGGHTWAACYDYTNRTLWFNSLD